MSIDDVQQEITDLEQALEKTLERQREAESALGDLDDRRNELAGRLVLAKQAASDYAKRLDERRLELEHARASEAEARVATAVAARDELAATVAGALTRAIDLLERLDGARAEVTRAATEASALLKHRPATGSEPAELESQWRRLVEAVRSREELQLEDDLVAAAAASPLGHEINNLPAHLQALARQRRAERLAKVARPRNAAQSREPE